MVLLECPVNEQITRAIEVRISMLSSVVYAALSVTLTSFGREKRRCRLPDCSKTRGVSNGGKAGCISITLSKWLDIFSQTMGGRIEFT
uniref:Uncharacterized protein n=1 Tax=Magallana gigas TaxID=29159 RepID=K1QUA7_MAGGI